MVTWFCVLNFSQTQEIQLYQTVTVSCILHNEINAILSPKVRNRKRLKWISTVVSQTSYSHKTRTKWIRTTVLFFNQNRLLSPSFSSLSTILKARPQCNKIYSKYASLAVHNQGQIFYILPQEWAESITKYHEIQCK